MPEAMTQPCAAAESSTDRGIRYAAAAALVIVALTECGMACLVVAGGRDASHVLYLLCSLALLVASVIAVRERARWLIAVRVAAIAAAVMLFWATSSVGGPSVTFQGRLHDLTPMLAGMLLAAVLLPALLRHRNPDITCNCQ